MTGSTATGPQIDPDSSVPIEAMIAPMLQAVVQTWTARSPSGVAAEMPRTVAILDVVAQLAASPATIRFRDAVGRRDPRALAALADIEKFLSEALDVLLGRLAGLEKAGEWGLIRNEAKLTANIARALGHQPALARTSLSLARADRLAGDVGGAITAYQEVIAAATTVRPALDGLLAIAYDNLGNLLSDVGRLDDALTSYDSALSVERQPDGVRSILANKANALAELGEFSAAGALHAEVVAGLEREQPGSLRLGIALDNAAQALRGLGDLAGAAAMLERAKGLLPDDDLEARALNALIRSELELAGHDAVAAAAAYAEAHDLAFGWARRSIDVDHYREGFANALRSATPPSAATALLAQVGAHPGQTAEQFKALGQAAAAARSRGDVALALRFEALQTAQLLDAGAGDQAAQLAWRVQAEASQRGLAYTESAALGMLGTLSAQGVDVQFPLGPMGAYVRAAALLDMHRGMVADAALDRAVARFETASTGNLDNELAKSALEHRAYALAVDHFERAVATARSQGLREQLLNRLCGLAAAKRGNDDPSGADAVLAEVSSLIADGPVSPRGEIVARRALAIRVAPDDRPAAIEHLRRSLALLEEMRRRAGGGAASADAAREFPDLARFLARLLHAQGDDTAAFDALQGDKARRTIAVLADLHGVDDRLASAREISGLLDADSVLVDIAMRDDGITAYVIPPRGEVSAVDVDGDVTALLAEYGDLRDRQSRLVRCALESPPLRELVRKLSVGIPAGTRVFLIPDGPLHNLPVHATPVARRPWYRQAPMAQLPAAGVLRFPCAKRRAAQVSFVAGDSRGDLPQAATECQSVAEMFGCTPQLGGECTRAALEQALRTGALDIVHLAVHGRGDARRGGRASLLFAGPAGSEWVPFDALTQLPWRVRLVVFSGCSTAVTGPRQGTELVGVARAALEAGAGAVVASLWPVGDESAKVLMVGFYESLRRRLAGGVTDIRQALDDARDALRAWLGTDRGGQARPRDGRDWPADGLTSAPPLPREPPPIAQALQWAPFVLIGNPVWQ